MADFRAGTSEQEAFLAKLLEAGVLIDSGVPGVYGRSSTFELITERFAGLITAIAAAEGAESLRFPPLLPRRQLEDADYLGSFPHLAGTIWGFEGDDSDATLQQELASGHQDWSRFQVMGDLVLTPAACYPVYPAVAARPPLDDEGALIDVGAAYVYRNEPSSDPARMQMFRQRELVRIGAAETVHSWREQWRERAVELLDSVGIEVELQVATDPFYGRSGRMMAASQRQQELKFEVVCDLGGAEPTALASFNYHQTHFGTAFGIELADGSPAHTACLGFGLERIALALIRTHGLDPDVWPEQIGQALSGAR